LSCLTPDFSAHFSPTWSEASVQEVYLSVSELDGAFRQRSELRFRYFRRPEIAELWPNEGYATRATQVILHGKYFANFEDLSVRAVALGSGTVELTWPGDKVRFMDSEHLLVEMPAASTPGGRGGSSVVQLEVSLSGGVDWATGLTQDAAAYTFVEEPQITSMSRSWANLRGGFDLTLEVLHLRFREDCPVPAEGDDCARPADVAYCRIGTSETVLRHVNSTHASCRVPAQAVEMAAPVGLRTLGGLFFGGPARSLAAVTLLYTDATGIHGLQPDEGIAWGNEGGRPINGT